MKWLITGGCGFIGTALIAKLAEEKIHSIRVVDNLRTGTMNDLRRAATFEVAQPGSPFPSSGVELVVGNIEDRELAIAACAGAQVVVHLAANTGVPQSVEDPRADCMANVLGTLNYLDAARRTSHPRFIFASSGAPAGAITPPIHEEIAPHPVSPYGASKLAGEGYCSAYARSYALETIVLRFGNVYGPGSLHKKSVVAQFVRDALSGKPMTIFGDGNQTRDFIYVDDLVSAILLAAKSPNAVGEIYQIASAAETTVTEIAQILKDVLEAAGVRDVRVDRSAARPGDVLRNYSDTTKALRHLSWQPKIGLREGLQKTVQYFVDSGGVLTDTNQG